MLSKIIKPGDRIEISPVEKKGIHAEENADVKIYISQVQSVLSDERMEIVMPMEGTKIILLPVDAVFDMYLTTHNGLYQCFMRVIDRYKSNNVYLLVVELTSNLRKQQRRDYYRFSCALEMKSRELSRDEIKVVDTKDKVDEFLTSGLPLKQSVIVDISGGGLRFLSNHQYEPGSLLYINYCLMIKDKVKEYNLVGKVLAIKSSENRKGVYEHRVQYVNIGNEEREEIIRYIFEEERKHRSSKR